MQYQLGTLPAAINYEPGDWRTNAAVSTGSDRGPGIDRIESESALAVVTGRLDR